MTMNFGTMRELHSVNKTWLPSKGVCYPENIEIAVTPLSIRERRMLEGSTQAEYYRNLLDGIVVHGDFDKNDLIFHDVNFLDLVRRIYTFEKDKKITISGYQCPHCGSVNTKVSFDFVDLEFEDFVEGIFGKPEKFTNEDGEEVTINTPGKAYTFSDGLTVYARPMTVKDYIEMSAKYLTNFSDNRRNEKLADLYVGLFSYMITAIKDREYKTDDLRREFIADYIGSLYKDADAKILDQIETDMSIILKPIKTPCPDCGGEIEVYVNPSMTFQQ